MHPTQLGLTSAQAQQRLLKYGENVFEQRRRFSVVGLLFSQFTSPFISILLVASFISLILGDFVDAGVIFLAVMINTILGFVQEYKAQNALAALSKVLSPQAVVIRDGQQQTIPASNVVPGDVVMLEEGEQIPADGYFIDGRELIVNEAVLTGESRAVRKRVASANKQIKKMSPAQAKDAELFGFMGTTVVSGKAVMIVLATGHDTQVGQIAESLQTTHKAETPLQRKLKILSRQLALIVGVTMSFIFVIGVIKQEPIVEMLKLAVAMFVSAIPEGLAISLTAILAVGMQRILKQKALVRKLVAAETLGSVTVICTDKTGTLTTGELSVTKVTASRKSLMKRAAALMNSAHDELEVAVRKWLEKIGGGGNPHLIDELPFTSQRKLAVKLTEEDCFMIGAPDFVLRHCSTKNRKSIEEEILIQARAGYRVVGVAVRPRKKNEHKLSVSNPGKFDWVGYFIFADQIRQDVKATIQKIQQAQIQVKVITGDYAETARAVLEQIGLEIGEHEVMLGHEFTAMPLSQFQQRVKQTKLFARTTPDQKLAIIQALQASGEVVAMTGDGVNDAPALKQADIGVVVSTATDVSKETADMVLLDDNFTTIVSAVEEGRGIFENLRKVILYLLANSFAETVFILGAIVTGFPLPMTAIQILWVNVVTDGLPNVALTLEPKEADLLKEPPRSRKKPLLDKEVKLLIGLISLTTGAMILGIFIWLFPVFELDHLRTLSFTMLAVMSLMYVFSSRSLREPLWRSNIRKNTWLIWAVLCGFVLQLLVVYWSPLQAIFETKGLGLMDWAVIFMAALFQVVLIEVVKRFFPNGKC